MTGKRRVTGFWFLLLVLILVTDISSVWAAEEQEEIQEKDYTEEILQGMELNDAQNAVDEFLGEKAPDIMETIKQMLTGKIPWNRQEITKLMKDSLLHSVYQQRAVFLQVALLIFACAVLRNFVESFGDHKIGEISFYMVYLILFTLLLKFFFGWSKGLSERLHGMVIFMEGLTPAYFLAISTANGVQTAAFFYQVVLLVIYGIQWVLEKAVVPGINLYVFMELVNRISREGLLNKLAELIQNVITWTLKTLLGAVVGMQIVQGMIGPVMDQLRRTTIGKAAASIPGIGNVVGGVTQVMVTSAVLIKNCMGVTFLLVLFIWGLSPLLQYASVGFAYKLLGALCQPIADSRMVECLGILGDGCFLLMKTLLTAEVLCMVSCLVLGSTFGGG